MNVDQALSRVIELEGEIATLQAEQARLVTRIVEDPCEGAPAPMLEKSYLREELRVALRESAAASENRIQTAQTLVHRLPLTLAAMRAGQLTWRHANALVNAALDLPDEDAAWVEQACVPFAADHDYTSFTRKIRRSLAALDTSTLEERVQRSIDKYAVWCYPNTDTVTATFGAVLPAVGARTVMAAVDTAADLAADHKTATTKTLDQRRAEGLVRIASDWLDRALGNEACFDGADSPKKARRLRRKHGPHVQVVVAASTLLGLDDQPGELNGHGPIPAALAREVAADPNGTWQRLVTDARGRLIDYGTTRYRPPARLREFIVARDRECQFPGCHRQGKYCEIDHLTPWTDGGETNQRNLVCLCRRHHHLKHDTTWTIDRLADGTLRWTSPRGRVHLNEPSTYPIDHTLDSVVSNDTTENPPPLVA